MKRIQTRIMVCILAIVLTLCIIFGISSGVLNYLSADSVLQQSLQQESKLAASLIKSEMEKVKQAAEEAGCLAQFSNPMTSKDEKNALLQQKIKTYGFIGGNVLGTDGVSIFDNKDYSDRDYFQSAIKGTSYVSGPLISKITGEYSIMIAAPIWEAGIPNSRITGVIYFKPDLYMLSEIMDTISIGETGGAYIVDGNGLTIAHQDRDLVCVDNAIEGFKTDKSLERIAKMETAMVNRESGYGGYSFDGNSWVQGYSPIGGTSWSVAVYVMESEFIGNVYLSIIITIALALIALVVGTIMAIKFGKSIADPIVACMERLELLTKGDLHTPMATVKSKDEAGQLASSLGFILDDLADVVRDISMVLGELANGNLTVKSSRQYDGDFIPIQIATSRIIKSFNSTMMQITQSSEQVADGSGQVSSGAQALSQGATEQASSIEELAATIHLISGEIQKSTANTILARKKSESSGIEMKHSNEQMLQMLSAMNNISGKSAEIGKIVKTIEDIAFQTNILALNAAVEAARAGSAGKGFAVVADEVRNLASKSADAAKNTTGLIEETVRAVASGVAIASATAEAMSNVVKGSEEISVLIDEIASSSEEQSNAVAQVNSGVDQISGVVQTNSATAEESAAASEELSAQAQMLKELVEQFKLDTEAGKM